MKTLTQIQNSIKKAKEEAQSVVDKKLDYKEANKQLGRIKRDLSFYREIEKYLLTNPDEEFVFKQRELIKSKIDIINAEVSSQISNKAKNKVKKDLEFSVYNKQLETLNYILL